MPLKLLFPKLFNIAANKDVPYVVYTELTGTVGLELEYVDNFYGIMQPEIKE